MSWISIGATHNGQQLQLVDKSTNGNTGLCWNQYPVKLLTRERDTIADMPHLLSVIAESCLSPSEAAGIAHAKIASPVITKLDDEYRAALLEYRGKLLLAEKLDLKVLVAFKPNQAPYLGGLFTLLNHVLAIFGITPFPVQVDVEREGSFNRIRWLHEVDIKEQMRLERIKTEIAKCMRPLVADLKALEQKQQVDMDRLLQVHQLSAIFKALFPEEIHPEIKAANEYLLAQPQLIQDILK